MARAKTVRGLLIIPLVAGLLMVLQCGFAALGNSERYELAQQLVRENNTAEVLAAEVGYVKRRPGPRGTAVKFDGVRVTFRTMYGRTIVTKLIGNDSDAVEGREGWYPPRPGSDYELPFEVLYSAAKPEQAMAKHVALEWDRSRREERPRLLTLAGIGVLLIIGSLVGRRWVLRSRS